MARTDVKRIEKIDAAFQKTRSHAFLSHSLVATHADKTSHPRDGMLAKQFLQGLNPINPQPNRSRSPYMNEVGQFSDGFTRSDSQYRVEHIIHKFPTQPQLKYIQVVRDATGYHHVFERSEVTKLSEKYCYAMDNRNMDSKNIGDMIQKGEVITKSTTYDDFMNFNMTRNGNTVYTGALGCFEDAVVISDEWAKAYTTPELNVISSSCNTNEVFTNLFGTENNYQSWVHIGEMIPANRLTAVRRIERKSMFHDLSIANLQKIFPNDNVKKVKGRLVDIDIYCNSSMDAIKKTGNHQLITYYENQQRYYKAIKKTLGKIIRDYPGQYSPELRRMYDRAYELVSGKKIQVDKSEFEHLHIKFYVLDIKSLHEGDKLAGFYGDKGVISAIWPKALMPKNEYDEYADVLISMIGPINRLNAGQFYEQIISFMSDNIMRKVGTMTNPQRQMKYILNYLKRISPDDYKTLTDLWQRSTPEQIIADIQDAYVNGLCIHQNPFWDNLTFKNAMSLWKYYGFKRYNCTYNNGTVMTKPLIMGDRAWLKLKHTPRSKVSCRPTGMLNQLGMPDKSRDFKKHQLYASDTPQRQGEMENIALGMAKSMYHVATMTRSYASDPRDREELNVMSIAGDPFNMDINIDFNRQTMSNMILCAHFKGMGYGLRTGNHPRNVDPPELVAHFNELGI